MLCSFLGRVIYLIYGKTSICQDRLGATIRSKPLDTRRSVFASVGFYSIAAAVVIALLSICAASDWAANIDDAGAIDPQDTAACSLSISATVVGGCTTPEQVVGLGAVSGADGGERVLLCGNCSVGLYGSACEFACPGLLANPVAAAAAAVGDDGGGGEYYNGLPCSGHGVCNASGIATTTGAAGNSTAVVAVCACDAGYQGVACDRLIERTSPTSLLPIIIAGQCAHWTK